MELWSMDPFEIVPLSYHVNPFKSGPDTNKDY